jgi:hypothetical protein
MPLTLEGWTLLKTWEGAGVRSEQIASLLRGQTGISSDRAHGDGVDRVMTWDHQSALSIAHDQVARLAYHAVAELLEDPYSFFLTGPWQPRHQMASSRVSTVFTPASSASTSSQS